MNADAYIPEFSAPTAQTGRGQSRGAAADSPDSRFDALLNEAEPITADSRRAHAARDGITDPRDRGIVPGGRSGDPRTIRVPGEPRAPQTGGGQPPEDHAGLPGATGGPDPFSSGELTPPPTGGPDPFRSANLAPPDTGGGTPFLTGQITAPSTGGGTPFGNGQIPGPSTGGGNPFGNGHVETPSTGGGNPFQAGTITTPSTGGGNPFQAGTVTAPATGGGQPPETAILAPQTGGGQRPDVSGAPAGNGQTPASALVSHTAQGDATGAKSAGTAKSAAQVASAPVTGGPAHSVTQGAANTAQAAAQPNTQAAVQTSVSAQTLPTGEQAVLTDSGRPRAILEKSAGIAQAAGAPKAASASMPASQSGAAANTSPAPGANSVRPALSPAANLMTGKVSNDPVQALAQRQDAPAPTELPPPADGEFEGELALQRQSAELRGAEAATRPGAAAQAQRLPAHTAPHLAAQVVRNFNQGQRQFEIRMDPPELGKIDVKLHVNSSDNRVHAVLSAERPETLADLQRSSRELERALAEAGLDLGDSGLEFELSQGGDDTRDEFGGNANSFGLYTDGEAASALPDQAAGPMSRLYGFALSGASGIDVKI